jgi:hypothetical protein
MRGLQFERALLPYYLSRALLSALLGLALALGGSAWWLGALTGALAFAGFLWYAHSGFYLVDTSRPLAPLRRDERGKAIRDRAAVVALAVGGVTFGALALLGQAVGLLPNATNWALLVGVIAYFVVSNWLYLRT